MKSILFTCFILTAFLNQTSTFGQRLTREQVNDTIHALPSFSSHQDNFFISGVPTNNTITKDNSDIKYQISFKQMVSRATLPLNSYLFVTYTQKAFWNVYRDSSPFEEINFNPGVGVGKPVFNREGYIFGLAELKFEHESNGRDSLDSRSWNRITGVFHTPLGRRTILSAKAWLPFAYTENHPDLLDYVGLGEVKVEQTILANRLIASVTVRKGLKDWKGSVSSRIYYKLFNNSGNQYLMLEWFAGYAESLIDYNKYTSMVRLGYVIKSSDLDILKTR
ncbi:phospholipase A [Gillisia hiemivivida]|uniref:Phosphatidylcholine 1-acylhydrolase n=1 Tax=Gillisia hiemivivida TaxID=291190 RepID=A0A5C6ZT11_9FLAO|nr:phospholipase A [Gillisia hiemivivida]TXD93517.1 phospholipase A [Gillisia hiemivivida]